MYTGRIVNMSRKPNLAVALQQSAVAPKIDVRPPSQSPEVRPQQLVPPSRTGKKTIAGHFDPAVSRQLRQVALEEDSSVQELLREAINDLFEKKGKPRLA